MITKQTIAVIGAAGNIGAAISRSLCNGNNRLLLFDNAKADVESLANEIRIENLMAEVEAMECATNACWEADVIILAVSYQEVKQLAEKIREVANQKIVISLVSTPGAGEAEVLQKLLPHSKITDAFHEPFLSDILQIVNN